MFLSYEIIVHMSRLEQLGKNIKKHRVAKNLKQKDLAIALDCTYDFISHVEHGRMALSLKKLFLLADILGVKMTDLINFD